MVGYARLASTLVHETRSSNAVYSTKFASECDVTFELYCRCLSKIMFLQLLHFFSLNFLFIKILMVIAYYKEGLSVF